jgi:hypothetical protein
MPSPAYGHVPERDIPIPTEGVSPQEQAIIGAPYLPIFNMHPKDSAEWKELVVWAATDAIAELSILKEKLGVTIAPTMIAGVKAFIITPITLPEKNQIVFLSMSMAVAMSSVQAKRECVKQCLWPDSVVSKSFRSITVCLPTSRTLLR